MPSDFSTYRIHPSAWLQLPYKKSFGTFDTSDMSATFAALFTVSFFS